MDKEAFKKLTDYLYGKRVFVQTHNFPDPDAIGAGFGFVKLLEHFDIPATLCYVGQIDRVSTRKMTQLCGIKIYAENELPLEMRPGDPVICIDSQKGGGNIKDLPGDEIACIDHHPTIAGIDYLYKDVRKTGSCATLIGEYFRQLEIEPEELTATALLYGLKMDTAHFTRGVTPMDIDIFAYLFEKASEPVLTELSTNNMEFGDLKAYGSAIENIILYDKVGFACIPFACPDAQIAVVADFILSLEEVDVAIIYSKRPNGYKFSVRSETPKVDAGRLIAGAIGDIGSGGGHSFMAGGFLPSEGVATLGDFPDNALRERFLKQVK